NSNKLPGQAPQIAELRSLPGDFWDGPPLSPSDNARIITAVTSLVGYTQENALAVRAHDAFSWLTGPIEAFFNAREGSMMLRNDEHVRMLDDMFTSETKNNTFFNSFVLSHTGGTPMNWIIDDSEIAAMDKSLDEKETEIEVQLR